MTTATALRFSAQDLDDAIYANTVDNLMHVEHDSLEEAFERDAFPFGLEYDDDEEVVDKDGYVDWVATTKRYTKQEIAAGIAEMRAHYEGGKEVNRQARVVTSKTLVGMVRQDQYDDLGHVNSPIQVRQAGYTATSPRYYLVALRAKAETVEAVRR